MSMVKIAVLVLFNTIESKYCNNSIKTILKVNFKGLSLRCLKVFAPYFAFYWLTTKNQNVTIIFLLKV